MLRPLGFAAAALVAAVLFAPSSAHAAADPFAGYVAALGADLTGPVTARHAGCDVLVTPRGEVRRPCALTRQDLVGDVAGVTLVVTRNQVAHLFKSQYEWRDATVEARAGGKRLATFRVVEILPYGGGPVRASHWIAVMPDKDASARAKAGTLPAPAAVTDKVTPSTASSEQERSDAENLADDLQQALRGTTDLRDRIADWADGGTIVVGSAPGQTLTGKKGARTLRGWKLDLVQQGGLDVSGTGMVGFAVTQVVGTPTGGKGAPITYTALVVYTQGILESGSLISGPRLVTFAIAPR